MQEEAFERLTVEELVSRLTDGATLRGVELVEADLSASRADHLTLNRCRFVDVSFAQVEWDGLKCADCAFVRCRFAGARLAGAGFSRSTFFDPDSGKGCTFAGARLRFATFKDCTLDSCTFEDADLAHLTLRGSRATGAGFLKAAFDASVTLTGNLLRYADLRGADLKGCTLTKNDLEWANLEQADLQSANLRDSSLNRASLRGASLQRADLRNANLGGLDLRTVEARGALIFEGQMRQLLEALDLTILPDTR